MKKLITCIVAVLALVCATFCIIGCTNHSDTSTGGDSGEHVHSYTRTVIEPTCSEKGHTLYECSCGDSYKESETAINPNGHNYDESGICTLCGHQNNTTLGIEYALSEDETFAEVVGYKGTDTKVSIASTYNNLPVKSISKEAFKNSNVMEVVIPETVTSIGEDAFSQCRELKSIVIPDSVTSIGNYAFADCYRLTSVTIPDRVAFVGDKAFTNCYRLAEIYNKSTLGITAGSGHYGGIGYYAKNVYTPTSGQSKLTTANDFVLYTDGDNKILIGYQGKEINLVLPEGITEINDYAFSFCNEITSIIIPNGVKSIGDNAFAYCSKLTDATIPETVTSIGDGAFIADYILESVVIPEGITSIGEHTFESCSELTSITIPKTVTTIGGFAFAFCNKVESIVIPDGVTSIDYNAFYGCRSLMSLTIGESVTSIGDDAFHGCYRLVEVYNKSTLNITVGYTDNGYAGFYAKAVYTESYTSKISNENGYIIYTDGSDKILLGYTGFDSDLVLPEDITEIDQGAFRECTWITSIVIPDGVKSIGDCAFNTTAYYKNKSNWENDVLYIGKHLIKANFTLSGDYQVKAGTLIIADKAFSYCTGLTSVIIPDGVTNIGVQAFYDCAGLSSITIPDSVTSIDEDAFMACTNIKNITCPTLALSYLPTGELETVVLTSGESIADSAFSACSILESIVIPETLTSIGNRVFYGCSSLANVTIPNKVASIGEQAFYGCSNFTSITIPKTVTSIGENAFYHCKGLESVYYEGTVDSWVQIDFSNQFSNPLYYADNLYINNELLTEANITTATEIKKNVFYTYTPLTSVTIGSSVTSIADHAFFDCYKLTSLTMGSAVKNIDKSAFGSCIGLNSVYYEGTIDEWVQIDFAQFDSNPLHLAHNLYINNELLTEANITTATEIKKFAFYGCKKLKSVTIGDSVTSIWFDAFYDCTELESIIIGNGVKSILGGAFLNCSGLKFVYYKGTEAEWNAISINNNSWYNDKLINATRYYYSETEPTLEGNYWHYDADGKIAIW